MIEGLSAVQGGQIDAMVGIALSVEYAVVNKNLRDLRVGLLPQLQYSARVAVRSDWPQLVEIMNKTLDNIPHGADGRDHEALGQSAD